MNKMRKNIRRVFWLYCVLFACVVGYLVNIMLTRDLANNPYNKRLDDIDASIRRGSIITSDGVVIAESNSDNVRTYPDGLKYAHIGGYLSHGMYGAEWMANFSLQRLHMEIWQRVNQILYDTTLVGNDMVLTIDAGLQKAAYDALGKQKGSIVAIEPSTGKILAEVSYPNFDPNLISNDWYNLVEDSENSPLVNRGTQGLYPPGSVFKIVTAAAIVENSEEWANKVFVCMGEEQIGTTNLHCFNGQAHGEVDLKSAFAKSCNLFFAHAGIAVGAEQLLKTGEEFLFNKPLEYPLEYNISSLFKDSIVDIVGTVGDEELIVTSIGQGKTLGSPLHMAMITAAIANGGVLMRPYIFDYEKYYSGGTGNKRLPERMAVITSSDTAFELTDLMVGVVEHGTGTGAGINGISVAGKTGTAENGSDADHAWFVGFAPADNPKIAVAVMLENAGSGSKAAPIAREIMRKALEAANE